MGWEEMKSLIFAVLGLLTNPLANMSQIKSLTHAVLLYKKWFAAITEPGVYSGPCVPSGQVIPRYTDPSHTSVWVLEGYNARGWLTVQQMLRGSWVFGASFVPLIAVCLLYGDRHGWCKIPSAISHTPTPDQHSFHSRK